MDYERCRFPPGVRARTCFMLSVEPIGQGSLFRFSEMFGKIDLWSAVLCMSRFRCSMTQQRGGSIK